MTTSAQTLEESVSLTDRGASTWLDVKTSLTPTYSLEDAQQNQRRPRRNSADDDETMTTSVQTLEESVPLTDRGASTRLDAKNEPNSN